MLIALFHFLLVVGVKCLYQAVPHRSPPTPSLVYHPAHPLSPLLAYISRQKYCASNVRCQGWIITKNTSFTTNLIMQNYILTQDPDTVNAVQKKLLK